MNKIIFILLIIILVWMYYKNNILRFTNETNEIPKVIYLCYKNKNIPEEIIHNYKELNPEYEVKLFDNEDCINFLKLKYGQLYVDIFNYLKDGPIKADFWRVCVLYYYGGAYFDIDVKLEKPINSFLENGVTFLTCSSFNKDELNPHFIMATKNHPVLKECIDIYIEKYNNKQVYHYWGYSIVYIMAYALGKKIGIKNLNYEGIYYDKDDNKYQLLKEIYFEDNYNINCIYNDEIILYNRSNIYDSNNHEFFGKKEKFGNYENNLEYIEYIKEKKKNYLNRNKKFRVWK